MENLNKRSVDLTGASARIIANDQIIENDKLKWRYEPNGSEELTLAEIAEQIGNDAVIYVWVEWGLRGEIFLYNGYGDKNWHEHGTTRGFA